AARARFRREAQATSALRSPHTVELYDFGVTDDGTLYYAMELLDGLDLETLVKRFGPMHPGRVLHVLEGVARSLAEAHDLGLVHRDIKPA
ncbi:MAG TPA: serine/threonine protein kinase, partial [Myxococcales bacterium]|nr:serine/threonine protein kinase [Myxococcales bacterium]